MKTALVQQQFDFMPPRGETERLDRVLRQLPDGDDALFAAAAEALRHYDAAMIAGDQTSAAALSERVDDIAIKLNGGSRSSMACDGGGRDRLARHFRVDGAVPPWGVPSRFVITAAGCRILITYDGLFGYDFDARAVDYDHPFISSTGFRSFAGAHHRPGGTTGKTVAQWTAEIIEDSRFYKWDGSRLKTPAPLEPIEGLVVHRGGDRIVLQAPRPPQDDPAWQPGGWIAALLADKPVAAPRHVEVRGTRMTWTGLAGWLDLVWKVGGILRPSRHHYARCKALYLSIDRSDILACSDPEVLRRAEALFDKSRYSDWPGDHGLFRAMSRAEIGALLVETRNRLDAVLADRSPRQKGPRLDPSRLPDAALDRLIQRHGDLDIVDALRKERERRAA